MTTSNKTATISDKQLEQIKRYAYNLMNDENQVKNIIHNWKYTEELIGYARDLIEGGAADEMILNEIETILIFFNLGYSLNLEQPLKAGAEHAFNYLTILEVDPKTAEEIKTSIANMARYNSIHGLAAAVAQDAATSYFGRKKLKRFVFSEMDEYNIIANKKYDKVKWISRYIDIISSHIFNTEIARKKWQGRKAKNLKKLKKLLYGLKKDSSLMYNKRAMTMFKTASRNQIDLVNIADKKAGIMITVNAILITLMLPLFASYIIDISRFMIPAILLLATSGISIILATLATKPIYRSQPTDRDYRTGNRSLFFFRNFINLNKDEYKDAVHEVIVSDGIFENSVITDLYDLGQTLGIKYKKLTWCYWVFAIGIGLTLITFVFTLYTFDSY